MSLLVENATVVIDPLSGEFSRSVSVAVEGGLIAAVGEAAELRRQYPRAERIAGAGALLLPGLIDAHTHLYAALTPGMPLKGDPPQNFPQVLRGVWWRWDKALNDQDVHLSALVGCMASIRNGITTIFDHHASPAAVEDSLSRVAAAVEQCGLRACLAYEVSDRDGAAVRDRGVAENRRFIREARVKYQGRIRGLFGLHAVYSLCDESLRRCAQEAADLEVGCHLHVAEHAPEVEQFARTHTQGIVQFLAEIGILGPKSIAAHTVQLTGRDIAALKNSGAFNVHNPKSNMGNGVGIAPVAEMMRLGQPVGLGSDGFYDLPQELQIAKLLQTLASGNPSGFSDRWALQMVYGHNARFAAQLFGYPFGKIAEGYAGDLILVSYDPPTPVHEGNLAGHLVAALSAGGVRTVIAAGRVLLREGELLCVDEERVLAQARAQAEAIWSRL